MQDQGMCNVVHPEPGAKPKMKPTASTSNMRVKRKMHAETPRASSVRQSNWKPVFLLKTAKIKTFTFRLL